MNKWFQFCFIAMGIIQSKRKVNMPWFKRFCHNAQVHLKTHFRWANIGFATHEIFSHVADFMEEFGGTGLGHLSEVHLSNVYSAPILVIPFLTHENYNFVQI